MKKPFDKNDETVPNPTQEISTKSYRPEKLPTDKEIEQKYGDLYRSRVRNGELRTDVQNLRFDEERQMYFFSGAKEKESESTAGRCTIF